MTLKFDLNFRRGLITLALMASPLAISSVACAGALVDAATEAEKLAAAGDKAGAYEILRRSTSDFSANMPLTIRKALFVSEKPVAFGSFKGAASNVFSVGTTLITYTEPLGLTWTDDGNGHFTTRFTADFQLKSLEGEVLASQKAFGNFTMSSSEKAQEVFSPLTLDIATLPAGSYKIRYTFNDLTSKTSASVEQAFTLK